MPSLATLFVATLTAATPATHTSADFIRACANGAEPSACQTEFNHATGTDAYRAAFNVTICLPVPAPGGGQDLLIAAVNNEVGNFVEWLKSHPERASEDSIVSILAAAQALYPCRR